MCNLSEAIEEKGIQQGIQQGKENAIYDMVQSRDIIPEKGAEKLDISVEQLRNNMEAAGYTFPY